MCLQEEMLIEFGIVVPEFTVHHPSNMLYLDVRHHRLLDSHHVLAFTVSLALGDVLVTWLKQDLEERGLKWEKSGAREPPPRNAMVRSSYFAFRNQDSSLTGPCSTALSTFFAFLRQLL